MAVGVVAGDTVSEPDDLARAEDIVLNSIIAGRDQVYDQAWARRINAGRPDFGIGMTSAEVSTLTKQIDVAALREYRDAVGLRTREIVGTFGDSDWSGDTTSAALEKAAATGADRCARAFAPSVTLTASASPASGIAWRMRSSASQETGGVTSAVMTKRRARSSVSRREAGGRGAVLIGRRRAGGRTRQERDVLDRRRSCVRI